MENFSCDMGWGRAGSRWSFRAGLSVLAAILFCADLAAQHGDAAAQPAGLAMPPAGLAAVPSARHLAAALSDQASRGDTLLTVATVARLLEYGVDADPERDPERAVEIEARFRAERAWLDRLAARSAELPWRPSLLDPPAWFLLRELDQHGVAPGPLVSPLGPDDQSVLRQVFDQSDEHLAAVLLPELLPRMELQSTVIWRQLLNQLPSDPALATVVLGLQADWFDPWIAAEPPAPAGGDRDLIDQSLQDLRAIVGVAVGAGPPDVLRLKRLRFELLQALPDLEGPQARDARYLLGLAAAVDGLYRREYLAFTGILLWVASDLLLDAAGEVTDRHSPLPSLLTELLPGFANAYARDFADVDPRINASLAAVFDVMQYLQATAFEPARLAALRKELADAVAQLVLLIPDMNYYFEQPVRERIAEEIDICISIAATRGADGRPTLSGEQFQGCLESLAGMASAQASRSELAGDPRGPFGTEQLRRELMLTPWQRINYTLGYLHDRHPTGCEPPAAPLANPLEWASLATVIVWFAQRSPEYLATPGNEARIASIQQHGRELLSTWVQQVDCISGAGNGLNDPVARGLADYRLALDDLVAGVREAELEFRAARLKPGSDVMLHADASQSTAFRSDDLKIGPCDSARICEMAGKLEATRALIGLFPDPYLIADQTGLGQIEVCYDNVQWVDRRSQPVRADDPHVADYFGRLSFDLVGRYREQGEYTNVFGFNFVSPDEYHYLFAAASDEVLADSCPVEWVGERILARLDEDVPVRIVPDRLTYLAAARSLPSQVMGGNWSRNQQWRDSFVTGLGVTPRAYDADTGIAGRVDRHLQTLYQAEQSMLYNALLRPAPGNGRVEAGSLYERLEELTARKALLRSYMVLFYPQFMLDSGDIRGGLEGSGSLLDRAVLRRFRDANVSVSSINELGVARLDRLQAVWSRQPEAARRSGSSALSMAHAMTRLDALHHEHFAQSRNDP
ncbi:MAG: hypothetical protein MUE63_09175 [Xanthomonadales bacterium]|nr:hypothetical protein [Xanthomonadales bacterium]